MRTPRMGEMRCLNFPSLVYSKDFLWRLGCIQWSYWPREYHINFQITQADTKAKIHYPQTESRAPLQRKRSIKLIENVEIKLVPTWDLYPYVLVFSSGRYATNYWKINLGIKSTKNIWPIICPAYKICWVNGATKFLWVANQSLICLKAHSMEKNTYMTLLG